MANPELLRLFSPINDVVASQVHSETSSSPPVDEHSGVYHATLTLVEQHDPDNFASATSSRFSIHLQSLQTKKYSADGSLYVCEPTLYSLDVPIASESTATWRDMHTHPSTPMGIWIHSRNPDQGWFDPHGRLCNTAEFNRSIQPDATAFDMDDLTGGSELRYSPDRVHGTVKFYKRESMILPLTRPC